MQDPAVRSSKLTFKPGLTYEFLHGEDGPKAVCFDANTLAVDGVEVPCKVILRVPYLAALIIIGYINRLAKAHMTQNDLVLPLYISAIVPNDAFDLIYADGECAQAEIDEISALYVHSVEEYLDVEGTSMALDLDIPPGEADRDEGKARADYRAVLATLDSKADKN